MPAMPTLLDDDSNTATSQTLSLHMWEQKFHRLWVAISIVLLYMLQNSINLLARDLVTDSRQH